jgi:hypothetical protein
LLFSAKNGRFQTIRLARTAGGLNAYQPTLSADSKFLLLFFFVRPLLGDELDGIVSADGTGTPFPSIQLG